MSALISPLSTEDEYDEIIEKAIEVDKATHFRGRDHETDIVQRPELGREIVRQAFEVFAVHGNELLAEVEREYTMLADFRNSWPGRHSLEGQSKLCRLRDLIAKVTGRSEQEVQDDYGTRLARQEEAQAELQP